MLKYYDPVKNWDRIACHLDESVVQQQLTEDFSKFIERRYGQFGTVYDPDKWPRDYETCDWDVNRFQEEHEYWKLIKHSACHWLVNTSLLLVQRACPERGWRICTAPLHSTIWDGNKTLFDLTFCALGLGAIDAFACATFDGNELAVGELLDTDFKESP